MSIWCPITIAIVSRAKIELPMCVKCCSERDVLAHSVEPDVMCWCVFLYIITYVCLYARMIFFCVHRALCSVLPMFAVSMSIESACGVCGFLLQTQNIHAAIQSILAVAQPSIQPHQSHNGTLLPILHVTTLKSNKMCIQNSTRIVYNLVHISHIFHTHKAGAK